MSVEQQADVVVMTDDGTIAWFRKAIFYEVPLKAFKDSTGSGMGDFQGLVQALDYLEKLGIDCVWLLPFYPSPWRDDGYDVADYYSIHPAFGSLEDFDDLVEQCHKRGIKVIVDLVMNHTSDQHPWFQDSRRSKDSPKRDWYVWSDTDEKYKGVRVIFTDSEESNWTYDELTGEYYWHRFYAHQPDLNYENPEVQEEMIKVLDFWLDRGLDGFRVDAVPYLFQEEGTSCESLPRTHQYVKRLRKHVDERYGKNKKILLAEANQMPEETLPYFGDGTDEFHMAFYFPLMPRIYHSLSIQDVTSIAEIIKETSGTPDTCQWCNFLRNHDELTLEMVTPEVRAFMWSFYAPEKAMRINLGIRRRFSSLLDNDRRKMELLNVLLFALPGSPIIYYGDEIGMGDDISQYDRNGVRTPMQWNGGLNGGFSNAPPDSLHIPAITGPAFGYHEINVEKQDNDPCSLLNFIRNLIQKRKANSVFAVGETTFLRTNLKGVLAFVRKHQENLALCLFNFYDKRVNVLVDTGTLEAKALTHVLGKNGRTVEVPQVLDLILEPYAYDWWEG